MALVYTPIWQDTFDTVRTFDSISWTEAGNSGLGSVYYQSPWSGDPMQSGGGLLYMENWQGRRYVGVTTGQWDTWQSTLNGPGTLSIPVDTDTGIAVEIAFNGADRGAVTFQFGDYPLAESNFFVYYNGWDLTLGTPDEEQINIEYPYNTYSTFRFTYINGRHIFEADGVEQFSVDRPARSAKNVNSIMVLSDHPTDPTFAATNFAIYQVIEEAGGGGGGGGEDIPFEKFWTRLTSTTREQQL